MEVVLISSTVVSGTSSVLNGLFLSFIIYSPPKHLGCYKQNYYLGSFTSFLFSFTHFLCAFTFYTDGTTLMFLSARRSGSAIFISFLAAHNALFIIFAYNFIRRYALISNNILKRWLDDPCLKYLYGSYKIFQLIMYTVPACIVFHPDKTMRDYVNTKFGRSLLVNFDTDVFYALSYDLPLFGFKWANSAALIGFISFGGLSIGTIIISGIGMYRFTTGKLCSEKMRKLNQRLLGTLTIQAMFSLLFVYMPGVICNIAALLRVDFSIASPYVNSAMSFGTLFNPIADLILTSDYRKKTKHIFNVGRTKATNVAMSVVLSQNSVVNKN